MIRTLSHVSIYVADQQRARDFYVDKLGFEVKSDLKMGDFRWLTVSPKAQPNLEIVLMPVGASPMMDEATARALREIIAKGVIGCGVLETDDCKGTYEELKKKGVVFKSPAQQRPYGLEALLQDDSGNWFSLVERAR